MILSNVGKVERYAIHVPRLLLGEIGTTASFVPVHTMKEYLH